MKSIEYYEKVLTECDGILRLVPNWVPRSFYRSGHRIRLYPDDTYAMGMKRGAVVERWFSSVTKVETEDAEEFEGMSYVEAAEQG